MIIKTFRYLKYSLASLFVLSSISNANFITSSTDIEASKLKQELKKEIELINMIESYILLNAPNDGSKFDLSNVNRQSIQNFYNLPSSFFTNYSGESCNSVSDLCENDTSGIFLDFSNDTIKIGSLIGSKKNEKNTNIFRRMHKKYKTVMFTNDFTVDGSISRPISTKIRKLKRNLNLYLKNPYPNSYIGYSYPTTAIGTVDTTKTWVRPNGEGGFNTYVYDVSDWELLSKSVINKYPTYGDYSSLKGIDSFYGAVMYSRYSNDESDYSKYGEMEFVNTGVYTGTTQERWSIKAANNMFITDVINITNSCSEQKNPLVGVDADTILNYKTASSEERLGDTISISPSSTYTTINVKQAMIKFRDKYKFVIDETDTSLNVLFNYRDATSLMSSWQADIETGSKTLRHNIINFSVYNKISNVFNSIKEIKINSVKFFNPINTTWTTLTPTNNVVSNTNEIQLTFDTISNNILDSMYVNKYKSKTLPSGTTYSTPVPDYKYDSSKYNSWYGDLDVDTYDGEIDRVKGYPMIVDYSIKVNDVCDAGKTFHDCYLVQTSTHGCYISKLKAVTITK